MSEHETQTTRPKLVGIAGGSGSGKTTLAYALAERFGSEHVQIIPLDAYYKAQRDVPVEQRADVNYDHPHALDQPLLAQHLSALRDNQSIERPVYDYALHDRADRTETVHPSRLVILEGILVLALPQILPLLDLKLFVDTDGDLRALRRLQRDIRERGRSFESVVEQYLLTVRPMHQAFIEPSRNHADLIVPWHERSDGAITVLRAWIQQTLELPVPDLS